MADERSLLPMPYGTAKTFNALNDVLFKFVFGKEEHKSILIDFLNTFLEKELEHPIKDLHYLPTEKIPHHYLGKVPRFDLACVLDSGAKVQIEVQLIDQKNMERRTLCYWARSYIDNFRSGQSYQQLVPVYVLNILNFELLDNPNPFATCGICDLETHQRVFKDLSISFIELPKFAKINEDRSLLTKMERWMCYLSDKLSTEDKEAIAQEDNAIMTAITAAHEFFKDEAERRAYFAEEIRRMDELSIIEGNRREAWEEGWAEGEAQGEARGEARGKAQGKDEEKERVVRNFLEKLPDFGKAAELLGIDLKEIRRIAEKFGLLH